MTVASARYTSYPTMLGAAAVPGPVNVTVTPPDAPPVSETAVGGAGAMSSRQKVLPGPAGGGLYVPLTVSPTDRSVSKMATVVAAHAPPVTS